MTDKILDYKETLNLPKTNFAMKANLPIKELEILKFWYDLDIYHKIQTKRSKSKDKKFILMDGPPYANGNIHIGHALNKTLKDIIVKSKSLSGYLAPFIPGWDCHGLPIELQVEKKIGKSVDNKIFRKKCREYANKQIDLQKESFKRLGILADWQRPYVTMDYCFEANIIRTLGKIIANGHLTYGNKPVHWCLDCKSALAEAEVEYQDKISPSIDIAFEVVDPQAVLNHFNTISDLNHDNHNNIALLIWTTTPWTLPANQAVSINKNFTYVIAQIKQRRLIFAQELLDLILMRLNIDKQDVTILGSCIGSQLENIELYHPFYDRKVPIILGEHVTDTAGTGCVHTAPAHGYEDYIVGIKYNLPIDNPVDANGCFIANTPKFAGMHVFKANIAVLEQLTINNKLISHQAISHSYPHCWRHKTPLIFRATKQWFISMSQQQLREKAIAASKLVRWIPDWGQARIESMLQDRPDWCISRQRTWGVPIPLFLHKITGEIHPDTIQLIEKTAAMVEKDGIDAWYETPIDKFLTKSEDIEQYEKLNDTLDVWFDSGAVYNCVNKSHPELSFPADLYLEGSDQHRGWFQTSLLSAIAVTKEAPYRQVLTHGYTVDADGKKMSKSQGNVVAPEQIIKTLGADILRLWVATTDYRNEINVSTDIIKHAGDAYRRIRNTARFLLSNLYDFNADQHIVNTKDMLILDQWIITQTSKLQQIIINSYDNYQFNFIYQRIHNFCVNELGGFYLDIIKDRQYTAKQDGIPRRSAQTALYYILHSLVRWIAPILSFTAEEIWQCLRKENMEESIFLTEWYHIPSNLFSIDNNKNNKDNKMNDEFWNQILQIRNCVNKALEDARKTNIIGSSLEAEVTLYCTPTLLETLLELKNELKFILITSKATVLTNNSIPSTAVATNIEGLHITIQQSLHTKCERCWHRCEDVNSASQYPNICKRCVDNLSSPQGEHRIYA